MKLDKSRVSIGSWLTLNHFSIAEIMADAGFEWLCIDIEHTVTDYFEVQQLIAAIKYKESKPFVRIGENNAGIIKRVLDAGAEGIIVPMVNSREDAIAAVNAVRYPPLGKRGVGLARAQKYGFGFEEYVEKSNENIAVIAQIEHIDAINNLNEILSVEGIDGSMIGPYDLSGSMGKPGKYNDEDVRNAIRKYEVIGKQFDKPIGFHVVPPEYKLVLEKIQQGYSFIAFCFDAMFLGIKCREQLQQIKNNYKI